MNSMIHRAVAAAISATLLFASSSFAWDDEDGTPAAEYEPEEAPADEAPAEEDEREYEEPPRYTPAPTYPRPAAGGVCSTPLGACRVPQAAFGTPCWCASVFGPVNGRVAG